MAISGHVIYIIGGNLLSKKHLRKYVKDKQHIHSRVSCINLVNHDALWKPLPERKLDFLFCNGWEHLVGIFDDMILFHNPSYFQAYDLKTCTKLDDPVVSTNFPSDLLRCEFDALIPLDPPGTFCLAAYSSKFDVPDITHLIFAKFRVVRNPSGQPRIIFISYYNLDLDCKACVTNYVPIVNLPSKEDSCAEAEQPGLGIYVGSHRI